MLNIKALFLSTTGSLFLFMSSAAQAQSFFVSEGSCLVQGGAGRLLVANKKTSMEKCMSECGRFEKSHPNRYCVHGSTILRGTPIGLCTIKGGAGKLLFTSPVVTNSQCIAQCGNFAQSNPNRSCIWSTYDQKGQRVSKIK
jgi:hypothetical protein